MELSEVQLFLIGLLAPIIVWLIKFWQQRSGNEIPSGWLTAGVYVVSLGLALVFGLPALPPFGPVSDPVSFVAACIQWLSALLVNIGPVVGLATLLYNALLKQVLDGLGTKLFASKPKTFG